MAGDDIIGPLTRRAGTQTLGVAQWWSVERVLYGMLLLIGSWLRLWHLGVRPLSPWEASNSWPAWLVANGLVVEDVSLPTSSLFYGLQWLVFWTGVNSDSGARFVSVVAGVLLIVTAWWLRELLGRRAALMLAGLIAIDPWLVSFSRLADGASLGLTLGMLTLAAIYRIALQPNNQRWQTTLAISFGLLVVSGPMGWNFVPVVLWWAWLNHAQLDKSGLWHQRWLLWLAGAVLLGATFGLARLEGVEWIASGTSVWLAQFDGAHPGQLLPVIAGNFDAGWPWLRVWTEARFLAFLGTGGLVYAGIHAFGRQNVDSTASAAHALVFRLCAGWLAWGVLLALLPGRSPLGLPMLGLPLLMLSALALDALLRGYPQALDWREGAAVVSTLLILLVSGMFWLTALLANRNYDPILAQAALVIFGLALAILVAFALWADRRDAAWLAATLVSALLLVVYVRSSWKLNFGDVVDEPAGWQATLAHPEVRLLVGDVETLSAHRAGDPHELPVQVQVAPYVTADEQTVPARPDPLVGWELRNMRNLSWVESPHVAADDNPLPLVLTPAVGEDETAALDLPLSYGGSRYHVDTWWLPNTLRTDSPPPVEGDNLIDALARRLTATWQPWWRWLVYREPTVAPQSRDVILWAPLDITK